MSKRLTRDLRQPWIWPVVVVLAGVGGAAWLLTAPAGQLAVVSRGCFWAAGVDVILVVGAVTAFLRRGEDGDEGGPERGTVPAPPAPRPEHVSGLDWDSELKRLLASASEVGAATPCLEDGGVSGDAEALRRAPVPQEEKQLPGTALDMGV